MTTTPKRMPPKPCPHCGEAAYFTPGEPRTYDHPGVDAGWACLECDNFIEYEDDDGSNDEPWKDFPEKWGMAAR